MCRQYKNKLHHSNLNQNRNLKIELRRLIRNQEISRTEEHERVVLELKPEILVESQSAIFYSHND